MTVDYQTSNKVTVYRSDNRFGDSPAKAIYSLFLELYYFRSHILTIFMRDFRASYSRTIFGLFWNFALPLIPVSVYMLLASFRVLPTFDGLPSSVAIVFNATIWFLLAGCVQQPIVVVANRNSEAMKTALPLSVSIISSFGKVLFDALIRSVLLIVVIIITGILPSYMLFLSFLLLTIAILLFTSCGLLLSILNIIAPDIDRVVRIALQYGLFISGVIFPLSSLGPLKILEIINPFAVFITAARDIFFYGIINDIIPVYIWSITGVILFIYAVRLFYLMEHRIRGIW